MTEKWKLLVNLPPTFFTDLRMQAAWSRLSAFADLRFTSHNTIAVSYTHLTLPTKRIV